MPPIRDTVQFGHLVTDLELHRFLALWERWVCDGSGHSANPTRLPDLWDPWWVVREVADAGWSRIWVASRSICALATEV
ncbi:hypothetical protein TIFTF001_027505 [Ficus carica]|uniref:Uncharacterized protein n=1 Tax=Ficus carica TaxID=3494 RepID=A0AA88DN57_FICCA|nr:hypothetical protein TIFTF001_027505 [Ficus carica]